MVMMELAQPIVNWPGTRLYLTFRKSAPEEEPSASSSTTMTSHGGESKTVVIGADGMPVTGPKHWFNVDHVLRYQPFHADFGPMNLAMVYRFCLLVHEMERDSALKGYKLIMWTRLSPPKMANGALLMSLYIMMLYKCTPADAFAPLAGIAFLPFRDAGYGRADFDLGIMDALYGVHKAIKAKLLRLDGFDIEEYEKYERVENGDFNWITPHFIAFASPSEPHFSPGCSSSKATAQAFSNVLSYFSANNVQMIVRLNEPLYERMRFVERGMEHVDMHFPDGTCPDLNVVRDFIEMADRVIHGQKGTIAVHCKAGLGRTGCLIGAWLIYTFSFTAREVIAFMRILRPGMCVGPQQHWLYQHEMTFMGWSVEKALRAEMESQGSSGTMSPNERPLTPPMEEVAMQSKAHKREQMPITPRRQIVRPIQVDITTPIPGQPRKTPARVLKTAPRLRAQRSSPNLGNTEGHVKPAHRTVSAPRVTHVNPPEGLVEKAKLTKEALQRASKGFECEGEDEPSVRYNLRKSTSAQSLHGESSSSGRADRPKGDEVPPVPSLPLHFASVSPSKGTNIPRPAKKRSAPPMTPRSARRASGSKRQAASMEQSSELEDSGKDSDELAIKPRLKSALPISVRTHSPANGGGSLASSSKPSPVKISASSSTFSNHPYEGSDTSSNASSSSSLTLGLGAPSTPTRSSTTNTFASYMSTPPMQTIRNTASQIFRAAMGGTPKRDVAISAAS